MGVFRKDTDDTDKLDWYILQSTWTSLYWRKEILQEDLRWFESEKYVIVEFDCSTWMNDKIMHAQLKDKLNFPDYYGENFNALHDCLSDLNIIKKGLVIVFKHLDSIKKTTAQAILDIVATEARWHLLFGDRLITLAQVDNPDYELELVGGVTPQWNGQEWLNSRREQR
jgi:RNAse (barnase) inhibitor barstar